MSKAFKCDYCGGCYEGEPNYKVNVFNKLVNKDVKSYDCCVNCYNLHFNSLYKPKEDQKHIEFIKDEIVNYIYGYEGNDSTWDSKMSTLMMQHGCDVVRDAYIFGIKNGELSAKALPDVESLINDFKCK